MESRGVESRGVESGGVESGGVESGGVESGGVMLHSRLQGCRHGSRLQRVRLAKADRTLVQAVQVIAGSFARLRILITARSNHPSSRAYTRSSAPRSSHSHCQASLPEKGHIIPPDMCDSCVTPLTILQRILEKYARGVVNG